MSSTECGAGKGLKEAAAAAAGVACAGVTAAVHGACGSASALLTLQQRSRRKYMRLVSIQ
jgi:hypothetical protein